MKRVVISFSDQNFTQFLKDLLSIPNEWRSFGADTEIQIKIDADRKAVRTEIYEWLKRRIEG